MLILYTNVTSGEVSESAHESERTCSLHGGGGGGDDGFWLMAVGGKNIVDAGSTAVSATAVGQIDSQ